MPTPNKGEERGHFVSRCVKEVMGEGRDQQAALGKCYGIWRQSHPSDKAKLFAELIKAQPSGQSVHVAGNGGKKGDKKYRRQQRAFVAVESESERSQQSPPGENREIPPPEQTQAHGYRAKAWRLPLTIKKADADKQLIFGWASVVMKGENYIVDKQGDIIPIDELENAVINYMLDSRQHGEMHARKGTGKLVMSFLTTPEYMKAFGLKQDDDLVGWIAGYKIEDPELWARHKAGELPEFSIGGAAVPFEMVTDDTVLDKARGSRRLARMPFRY